MRWPWNRRGQSEANHQHSVQKAQAERALESAEEELEAAKERGKEVKRSLAWFLAQREENHFAPAIIDAITRERR